MLNNSPAFRGNRLADAVYLGGRRLWTRPETLSLDFANDVYRMGSVTKLPTEREFSELITFTRGSGGGITNAQGKYEWLGNDAPRFDYDPVTKAVKGLLIEEQRTNLLTYSEDFGNGVWAPFEAAIRANVGVAPDGTLSADGFIPSTVTTNHFVRPSTLISVTSGVVWTATCFFKAAGHTKARITFEGTGWVGATQPAASFSLEDGAVYSTSASAQFAAITPAGDGWYRCSLTSTATSTFNTRVGIWAANPDGTNGPFAGDGTSGIYIWGAQLEVGSFPTSYIPTKATFTARNSIGTYIDNQGVLRTAAADIARYDHGYIDGQWVSKGLLLEGQSTNFVLNSNQFDGGWSHYGITIDGYVTAPDGTAAPIWLASTTAELHRLQRPGLSGGAGNTVHTGSFYCHLPVGHDVSRLYIRMRSAGDGQTVAVLVSGSGDAAAFTFHSSSPFGTNAPPLVNASALNVTPAGNGWHRIAVTSTTSTTTNQVTTFDFGFTRAGAEIASGTPSTRIAFFGAQLEVGDRPTSYIPTPAVFTSRASTKTYFDNTGVMRTAAVDEAAIDHGLVNGVWVNKGLSVEGQATNLLLNSETFSDWWKTRSSVVSSAVTPPSGQGGALLLREDTQTSTHYVHYDNPSIPAGNYTFSVYVKKAQRHVTLEAFHTNGWATTVSPSFNLDTLEITGTGVAQGTITDVGGGWFRCAIRITATEAAASRRVNIILTLDNRTVSYVGDGTSGLYIWGAQLEAGSRPTSYIPTTTAQVTRAADVTSSAQVTRVADSSTSSQVTRAADMASVNDLSGWYRQDEGTLVVGASTLGTSGDRRILSLTDGTSSNRIGLHYGPSGLNTAYIVKDGVAQFAPVVGPVVAGREDKFAFAYREGDMMLAVNGALPSSVTGDRSVPAVDRLQIGNLNNTGYLNGHIKSIKYLPRRVSSDELKALTV